MRTVIPPGCRLHYMNVAGYCKLHRPVLYSCMKLSRSKEVTGGKHHLINRFEQVLPVGCSAQVLGAK